MSPEITIRDARPEDARAIAEVHVEGWRWGYRDILPAEHLASLSIDEREAQWLLGLTDPVAGTARFVAIDDAGVVGFAGIGPADDDFAPPPSGAAELHAIYMREATQGTGVGRALIERATETMRASGSRLAVLWVFEGNDRARRFYEAAGWSRDGARAEYRFEGGTRPVIRYARDL